MTTEVVDAGEAVTITRQDGREVPGYGQTCMQPDGSWRLGALQPERY